MLVNDRPLVYWYDHGSYARGFFGEISHVKIVKNYGFVSHRYLYPNAKNETVAFEGGSWIKADQVTMEESIGFQLDDALSSDVYPISASMPNLAQNLGFVIFAADQLRTDKVVVFFASDNMATSIADRYPGKWVFDKNGELTIASDFTPSPIYRSITSLNITNYLFKNFQIQRLIFGKLDPAAQSRDTSAARAKYAKKTEKAIGFFIDGLKRSGFAPADMLFIFAPNLSSVAEKQARPVNSNFHKLDKALKAVGFTTYDLFDAFLADFDANNRTFEIPGDSHWTGYAQALAARLIAAHPTLAEASTVED